MNLTREQDKLDAAKRSGLSTIKHMRDLLDELATFRVCENRRKDAIADLRACSTILETCYKVYGDGMADEEDPLLEE
ncbi:MAG: hypothetical protein PUA61_08380 [Succinatimonas hippei]|nr:hypothetical protein [Succinatimonas hippei]